MNSRASGDAGGRATGCTLALVTLVVLCARVLLRVAPLRAARVSRTFPTRAREGVASKNKPTSLGTVSTHPVAPASLWCMTSLAQVRCRTAFVVTIALVSINWNAARVCPLDCTTLRRHHPTSRGSESSLEGHCTLSKALLLGIDQRVWWGGCGGGVEERGPPSSLGVHVSASLSSRASINSKYFCL